MVGSLHVSKFISILEAFTLIVKSLKGSSLNKQRVEERRGVASYAS